MKRWAYQELAVTPQELRELRAWADEVPRDAEPNDAEVTLRAAKDSGYVTIRLPGSGIELLFYAEEG